MGGYYYNDYSNLNRLSFGNPFDGSYSTTQKTYRVGGFKYGYFGRIRTHLNVYQEIYYDTQNGNDFSFSIIPAPLNLRKERVLLDTGAKVNFLENKLGVGLNYLSYVRYADRTPQRLVRDNLNFETAIYRLDNRVSMSIDAQPHPSIYFQLGFGIDLDGDAFGARRYFDKGFGKFIFLF